jgi:hypothetical protein
LATKKKSTHLILTCLLRKIAVDRIDADRNQVRPLMVLRPVVHVLGMDSTGHRFPAVHRRRSNQNIIYHPKHLCLHFRPCPVSQDYPACQRDRVDPEHRGLHLCRSFLVCLADQGHQPNLDYLYRQRIIVIYQIVIYIYIPFGPFGPGAPLVPGFPGAPLGPGWPAAPDT